MAAFVQAAQTFNTTSGTKTATITPAVNGLLVVVVANTGNNTTPTLTDDKSGGTYTAMSGWVNKATNADQMTVWFRDNLVASAVLHTLTMTPGTTTGGGLAVMEFSGMTKVGSAVNLQGASNANQTAGTTPGITFGGNAKTTNPTVYAVLNATNPAGMTVASGWTQRENIGYNTPTTGLDVETRDSGFTGSQIISGGTSATAYGVIGVELDASSAALTPDQMHRTQMPALLAQ